MTTATSFAWVQLAEQIEESARTAKEPSGWADLVAAAVRQNWPYPGPSSCRLEKAAGKDAPRVSPDGGEGSLVRAVAARDGMRLTLEASVPEDGPAESRALLQGVLAMAARHALACWQLGQQEGELRQEGGRLETAELAGVLIHQFNNVLNNITLQLVLLDRTAPPQTKADLAEIRRQIVEVSGLVRKYHQAHKTPARPPWVPAPGGVLRQAVEAAQATHPAGGIEWQLDLPDDLPALAIGAREFRLLCDYLLRNALAGVRPAGGVIAVQAASGGKVVSLTIRDSGPAVPAANLSRVFVPTQECRPGANGMELATARSIIRRTGGRVNASSPPDGGLEVVVEVPVFAEG